MTTWKKNDKQYLQYIKSSYWLVNKQKANINNKIEYIHKSFKIIRMQIKT